MTKDEKLVDLAHLIAWLQAKPAEQPYPTNDPCHCLLAQWTTSRYGLATTPKSRMHGQKRHTGGGQIYVAKGVEYDANWLFWPVVINESGTFGAALSRAKAFRRQVQESI